MNKILSPILLILFLVVAYIIFDFQLDGAQKLNTELQNERQLRGQYYCQQIVRELQYLPDLDKQFLEFLNRLINLQPNEIIKIELKIEKEYLLLWSHPKFEKGNGLKISNICIKSQDFKFKNVNCNVLVYLQPSNSMKILSSIQTLQERLTILLIAIVFLTALFLLYLYYKRSEKEKNRIASELRQKEISSQIEIHKREKATSEMREQLKAQEQQLRHADKMNSLGTLASGMAHEINNPNSYIALNAETLEKAWRDVLDIINNQLNEETKIAGIPYKIMRERIPTLTQAIKEGSDRIRNIVADLKHFSGLEKNNEQQKTPINIKSVLDSALRLTNYFILKHTDHLMVENTVEFYAIGYRQRLEQVIVNLLINAAQSLENKEKKIYIKTYQQAQKIYIEVSDEGCGIPTENLDKIFDPFFTTKTNSGGTGLGLSISYAIIQDMQGEIKVSSIMGKGSMFIIELPKATSQITSDESQI